MKWRMLKLFRKHPFDNEAAFVGEVDDLAIDFETNPDFPSISVKQRS